MLLVLTPAAWRGCGIVASVLVFSCTLSTAGSARLRAPGAENTTSKGRATPEQLAAEFYAALNASGVVLKAGRPACAHDLPPDSEYWSGQDKYGMGHHKCKHSGHPAAKGIPSAQNGCPYISNADRVSALRKLLGATKTLMANLNIDYILYGGTAIGQYRCGDVLPWDGDNDILVPRKDLFHMHQVIYGRPWNDLMANETIDHSLGYSEYSKDLAEWGIPGFKLMKKSNCIIYELVDVNTGFITDMFPLDYHQGKGLVPWPGMHHYCSTWTKCSNTCYSYADAVYWPIKDCTMSKISMRCAQDRATFLTSTYDSSVLKKPDVWTR